MGRNKNVMHNDSGKKISHPADAIRRKDKKRRLEQVKKDRLKNYEGKILGRSPDEIQSEIMDLERDQKRKEALKIDVSKMQKDKLTRLKTVYKRMEAEIEDKHKARQQRPKSSMEVDFEELKLHRKSSIYYHPVMNPYGAPPSGQTLKYKHPDGSIKTEPPAVVFNGAYDNVDKEDKEKDKKGKDADLTSDSGSGGEDAQVEEVEEDDDEDDDEDDVPMLPDSMPGMEPSSSSTALPYGLPPLPPGMPPLPPGRPPAPGLPPLPPGAPPRPGLPPLPFGFSPGPGLPPLPPGMPDFGGMPGFGFGGMPGAGLPPLPAGPPPGPEANLPFGGPAMSQADFAASLAKSGFAVPGFESKAAGKPPGPPPKPGASGGGGLQAKPGPPGGGLQAKPCMAEPAKALIPVQSMPVSDLPAGVKAPPPPAKPRALVPVQSMPVEVSDLPAGAKAPPPPAKAVISKAAAPRMATMFTPTSVRTKKPAQIGGSSQQVSSSSLTRLQRNKVISTERPVVNEKMDIDGAFEDFLSEIG